MKVNKTVRGYSKKLSVKTFEELEKLFNEYAKVENEMLHRFCGIQYMSDVCKWNTIRDKVREEQNQIKKARKTDDKDNKDNADNKDNKGINNSKDNEKNVNNGKDNQTINASGQKLLTERYEIQGRHWVMAIKHACSTLSSMWANLGNRLKTLVRDNKNLTPEMRAYCYYILSAIPYWQKVLLRKSFDKVPEKLATLMAKLTDKELKKCNNYICRITRKHKPYPEVKNARCMMYDENMYSFKDEKTIKVMSKRPQKKILINLRGPFCYSKTGDIQLILDRDKRRIEIHKLIKARATQTTSKIEIGPDKGFATLLSCYSGNEYGYKFGELVTERSDYLNERNTNRNIIFDRQRKLKDEISELDKAINKTTNDSIRIPLIRKKKEQERRLQTLEANNIGNKKFNREQTKAKETIQNKVNYSIKLMLDVEDPCTVGLEDLTWQSNKSKGKKMNRRLSLWNKGYLDERIEYIGSTRGIKTIHVNAAYTSQYCAKCGAKIEKRIGDHHEIAVCPNCGEINANTNASGNIEGRIHDPEITIYTPYHVVKDILDRRYAEKCNKIKFIKAM